MENPTKNSQAHKKLTKAYPDLIYTKDNRLLIHKKGSKRYPFSEETFRRLQNGN